MPHQQAIERRPQPVDVASAGSTREDRPRLAQGLMYCGDPIAEPGCVNERSSIGTHLAG